MSDKPREISRELFKKIQEAAYRSYELDQIYFAIAQDMGTNTATVNEWLKLAEQLGVVRHILYCFDLDLLKTAILEKFPHLKQAIVVPLSDSSNPDLLIRQLGVECAEHFLNTVDNKARIGVSCGNAVNAFNAAIGELKTQGADLPSDCWVYQLVILMNPEVKAITPAALVSNLTTWLPGATGQAYQLPRVERQEDLEFYRKNLKEHLAAIERLQYYVIGVGYVDYGPKRRQAGTHEFNNLIRELKLLDALKRCSANAESIYQPLDESGNFLIARDELAPLRKHMFYLPLEVLRKHVEKKSAEVIAVAGGKVKHPAVHAGLRAKIFNVLITDFETAEYVLKKEGVQLPSPVFPGAKQTPVKKSGTA